MSIIGKNLKIDRKIISEFLKENNILVSRHNSKAKREMNIISHLKDRGLTREYIKQFDNIDKFRFLLGMIRHEKLSRDFNYIKLFMETFYNNEQFNKYYDDWIYNENKASYAKPSLDHIIPLSKGGTWDMNNLQIIPWCLNRAKDNYSPEEWIKIKKLIGGSQIEC